MLLGILPFALFAYFSIGQSETPEPETPQVVPDEALNAESVQLAFPFGGPPPPPVEPVVENVPLELPVKPAVPASAKQCSNGRDDDRDGRRDYPADPGCRSRSDSTESPNPVVKAKTVKAAPVAPRRAPVAPAPAVAPKPKPPAPAPSKGKTACTDGRDNDGDGKVDGA
ncbi:MAG TPA: hypothetical protein VHI31_08550, partial [Actinomycetota bacterium]|nr:hypothetical protein [Actinomycetota bacterium]